jgi:hypothetical protein
MIALRLAGAAMCAAIALSPTTFAFAQAPAADDAPTAPTVPPTAQIATHPMPARRAELEAAAAKGDFAAVNAILAAVSNLDGVNRNMDWEELQVVQGGGVLYGFHYVDDLWTYGTKVTGDPNAEKAKLFAGVIALYMLQQIEIDASRCADSSAPGHRIDQLAAGRRPLWTYVLALPEVTRRDLAVEAIKLEARTAKLRRDDPVLCSGGAADMAEALKNDNRPLGSVSGSLQVPVTPHPSYVDPAVSAPKQDKIRAGMTMVLARALKLPEAQGK